MKVNWDGAIEVGGKKTSLGGVARDSSGVVRASVRSSLSFSSELVVAKRLWPFAE